MLSDYYQHLGRRKFMGGAVYVPCVIANAVLVMVITLFHWGPKGEGFGWVYVSGGETSYANSWLDVGLITLVSISLAAACWWLAPGRTHAQARHVVRVARIAGILPPILIVSYVIGARIVGAEQS